MGPPSNVGGPDGSSTILYCSNEDEFAMSESLDEIAKRIAAQPWNRPGTDKTWVLNAMATHLRFRDEVRKAKRVRRR